MFEDFYCIRYVYITIFIRKSAALGGGKISVDKNSYFLFGLSFSGLAHCIIAYFLGVTPTFFLNILIK